MKLGRLEPRGAERPGELATVVGRRTAYLESPDDGIDHIAEEGVR